MAKTKQKMEGKKILESKKRQREHDKKKEDKKAAAKKKVSKVDSNDSPSKQKQKKTSPQKSKQQKKTKNESKEEHIDSSNFDSNSYQYIDYKLKEKGIEGVDTNIIKYLFEKKKQHSKNSEDLNEIKKSLSQLDEIKKQITPIKNIASLKPNFIYYLERNSNSDKKIRDIINIINDPKERFFMLKDDLGNRNDKGKEKFEELADKKTFDLYSSKSYSYDQKIQWLLTNKLDKIPIEKIDLSNKDHKQRNLLIKLQDESGNDNFYKVSHFHSKDMDEWFFCTKDQITDKNKNDVIKFIMISLKINGIVSKIRSDKDFKLYKSSLASSTNLEDSSDEKSSSNNDDNKSSTNDEEEEEEEDEDEEDEDEEEEVKTKKSKKVEKKKKNKKKEEKKEKMNKLKSKEKIKKDEILKKKKKMKDESKKIKKDDDDDSKKKSKKEKEKKQSSPIKHKNDNIEESNSMIIDNVKPKKTTIIKPTVITTPLLTTSHPQLLTEEEMIDCLHKLMKSITEEQELIFTKYNDDKDLTKLNKNSTLYIGLLEGVMEKIKNLNI